MEALDDLLRTIATKIASDGPEKLGPRDRLVWNTAVVISTMTSDVTGRVPNDAKVFSWGSARAGFVAMGAPEAGEIISSLVLELAHRSERRPLRKAAGNASLLRLASLKTQFCEIDRETSLWDKLASLVTRADKQHRAGSYPA